MRIVHVLAPAPYGGLESVVRLLGRGLRDQGTEAHVLATVSEGDDLGAHPFLNGCRSAQLPVHLIQVKPRAYLRERAEIRAACERLRPDVIHTHGYRADLNASSVARGLGIPTVTTVHGFTGGGFKNRLYEKWQRRAFRAFDAVIAVSRKLETDLAASGVAPEKTRVIRNAWTESEPALSRRDARRQLGLTENGCWLGWIGRLSAEKGADILIDALAELPAHVHCALIGDGPERERLIKRAQQRNLSERIRFVGRFPDAGRLARAFDCFVLSSRTEGTPIVLFEAMSAGVPIVAAAVGGVPDVIDDSCACLIPPERPAQLAAAIQATLNNGDALPRTIKAQQRLATLFGLEPWVRQHQDLYHELTN